MTQRPNPLPRLVALLSFAACGESVPEGALAEAPIAGYRLELLDLAFRAASALPLEPHHKNRSRAQESVVLACLELEQPKRALRFLQDIRDWRRGFALAELAFHCAARGGVADATSYLDQAVAIAGEMRRSGGEQDWRCDRIRAAVARVWLRLGDAARAAEAADGLVESERLRVASLHAELADTATVAAQLAEIDRWLASGGFEASQRALVVAARLFARFHADAKLRPQLEQRIRDGSERLPVLVRFDLFVELAEHALARHDRGKARELLEPAAALLATGRWLAEQEVPLQARLAALRWRCGDEGQARSQLDAALTRFTTEQPKVVDIERAGVLRAIAAAYAAIGDPATSLEIHRRAAEAGVVNPNSRPRAEDLVATCLSLARCGIEPDAALQQRLRLICDRLGDPW